jgi:hypothetical protein
MINIVTAIPMYNPIFRELDELPDNAVEGALGLLTFTGVAEGDVDGITAKTVTFAMVTFVSKVSSTAATELLPTCALMEVNRAEPFFAFS